MAFKLPCRSQLQLAYPRRAGRGYYTQVIAHARTRVRARPQLIDRTAFLPSFQYFDLAESDGCKGDRLLLTSTWSLESRLCGSVLPPPFISTRGRVWLHFRSLTNSSGQAQGFRLSYIRGELEDDPEILTSLG